MKKATINKIAKLITRIEGGKSQIKIGDARELASRLVLEQANYTADIAGNEGPLDLLMTEANAVTNRILDQRAIAHAKKMK